MLTQLGECCHHKAEVVGSSPIRPTTKRLQSRTMLCSLFIFMHAHQAGGLIWFSRMLSYGRHDAVGVREPGKGHADSAAGAGTDAGVVLVFVQGFPEQVYLMKAR